ncbi:MAG: hypothetical protein HOP10_16690 [Chitinophagaceae bacterium]|nr:hypothetical protein [Chitinophagaceae bacterium]
MRIIATILSASLLLLPDILDAQDTARATSPKFPVIRFVKKSTTVTKFAQKQLDSVIAISNQYPEKCIYLVVPDVPEEDELKMLVWDRMNNIVAYIETKGFDLRKLGLSEEGSSDGNYSFEWMAECAPYEGSYEPPKQKKKTN